MKFEPVLPTEMEKTATSHNYISNHFPDATLLHTYKKKKLKNCLKSGAGKADFTSMIEGLDLFKANSDKPPIYR